MSSGKGPKSKTSMEETSMEIVTGIFNTHEQAVSAVHELQKLGLSNKHIGLVSPDQKSATPVRVPVTDTEDSGMGKAMGAAVGGAMGAAGGATLGLAAASILVPGVGPVLAFGLLGAALLGGTGAALGAVVGDSLEEGLGEGIPHEDIYLYEDALRHGRSVVVVYADEGKQTDDVREVLNKAGALNLDDLREDWWAELRDEESNTYQDSGRDFENDELSYRRGFEAAQHPIRRGRSYGEAEDNLRESYSDDELDDAFQRGYERGRVYRITLMEIRKS
jgi:hypothetical protein